MVSRIGLLSARLKADTMLNYGKPYGIDAGMSAIRKITVQVPESLLEQAQKSSGQGITETVRRGLQLVAAGDTYRKLRELRGAVSLSIDIETLREDRL